MAHYGSAPGFPIFNLVQYPQSKTSFPQYPGDVLAPWASGKGVTIPTYNSASPTTTMLALFDTTGTLAPDLPMGIYAIVFRGYEDAINTVGGVLFFGVTGVNTILTPYSMYTGNISLTSPPLSDTLSIASSGTVIFLCNTWSGSGGTNGTADWVLIKFI